MFRYCPEGHGLVRSIGDSWKDGLDDFEDLFQHYDSMVLWN